MFFALVVLVSLGIALARGRSLDSIAGQPFRWWSFALVGVLLHLIVNLAIFSVVLAWRPPGLALPAGALLYLASFGFLILFLLANLRQPGFAVLLVGMCLNLVEIALNGGQMPGEPGQLAAAGLLDYEQRVLAAGRWLPFSLISPETRLAWLGDRIFFPLPFRQPVILSVGDLIIALGCFWFCNDPLHRATLFPRRRRRFDLG